MEFRTFVQYEVTILWMTPWWPCVAHWLNPFGVFVLMMSGLDDLDRHWLPESVADGGDY
jgi:hypothetical protein